jgi:hypothetical protein
MATALLPIVLALADTAEVTPVALALPAGMIIRSYPLLMFYNTLPSILVYGTGMLRVKDSRMLEPSSVLSPACFTRWIESALATNIDRSIAGEGRAGVGERGFGGGLLLGAIVRAWVSTVWHHLSALRYLLGQRFSSRQ